MGIRSSRTPACIGGALALLASVLLAAPAMAQDIQAFKPAVGTWNYFGIEGGSVAEPGDFVPSMYLSYARNPLVQRDAEGRLIDLVVENLTTVELLLAVGIHERVEVGIAVPFGYGTGTDRLDIDTGAGLGDIRLMPKFILLGAGERTGFAIALGAPLNFPTGEDSVNSSRYFIANPELILEYRASWLRIALNGGYRYRPTNSDTLEPLTVGDGITYGAAIGSRLGTDSLEVLVEASGTIYSDVAEDQGGPNPLEAIAGLRLFNATGLVFSLAAGAGIVADFGAPELRVIGGLSWQPDNEPQSVIVAGGGAVAARADDGDDDADGVKNSADACPTVPEDADGFEDADGCPDTDNDQDGIADAEDACPKHGEDIDGFEDTDGCPDPDNDQDGVADANDGCPGIPETKNGFQDADGCPDEPMAPAPAVAQAAPRVVVRGDRIQHLDKIYFELGRARIRPESYNILDQVAQVIRERPEITRIRVEGHTDVTGTAGFNLWLSRMRAKRVTEYLIKAGVEAHRLESVGLGEDAPIGDGQGRIDAARSRRVEFIIRERDPARALPISPAGPQDPAMPDTDDGEAAAMAPEEG